MGSVDFLDKTMSYQAEFLWAQKPYLNRSSSRQATTASIELPATKVHSKKCISTTRRNFGMKPIFTEVQLNYSSLRLGFQPNHEAAFSRINHGIQF
ncbi:hypothetical protein F2Q70_00038665 [Brassica cretica]|uniref:Uncharacterized protein n=1 Tax=Brassica cretica TaxID=69181 RepID=A0A8S9K8G1_BRACR|nr:hypothetical protein F2Q70_00038665 [Brassica cretica]